MRDHDDGALGRFPNTQQLQLQLTAGQGVKRAEGFIEKHNWRVDGESPRETNTLLHTARKTGGATVRGIGKPYLLQVGAGNFGPLGFAQAGARGAQTEIDVAARGHPRQQRVVLKDHAAIGAWTLNFLLPRSDCAGGRLRDTSNHF